MQAPPPDIPQDYKTVIFSVLDLNLNTMVLQALLHGLCTGIVMITLWTIFSSPKKLRSTFLRIIIITLYVLSTILFGMNWAFERRAFIGCGDNYYSVYTTLVDISPWWKAYFLVGGITGGTSTLLVDITIIWRCWILWDRQWRLVSLPIICAVSGTVMKVMQILSVFHDSTKEISKTGVFAAVIDWSLIYISLTLATNITCTFLITYRIVRHTPRMSASRKIVEMLIESSAMYSLSLIVYLVLVSKNSRTGYYTDIIAAYIKTIAPTFLVGRVSAHAKASSYRQKMVAMWENHPPLVGCFREENTNNSQVCHFPDDGHQTLSGLSGKETV
ncbi:hypothetical protein DFS33DRAFT_979657 [Desarmillaria ectypa]|nr:hypothetical protein DFS33DRAFT_979657 [Desarmillaria ectypa]